VTPAELAAKAAQGPLALEDFGFLELMPAELRGLVAHNVEEATYPFGAEIAEQGKRIDSLFMIRSGRVRRLVEGEDGTEIPLADLGPGETFGELGVFEEVFPHFVRAKTPVAVFELDVDVLRALMRSHRGLREFFELRVRRTRVNAFLRAHSASAACPRPRWTPCCASSSRWRWRRASGSTGRAIPAGRSTSSRAAGCARSARPTAGSARSSTCAPVTPSASGRSCSGSRWSGR